MGPAGADHHGLKLPVKHALAGTWAFLCWQWRRGCVRMDGLHALAARARTRACWALAFTAFTALTGAAVLHCTALQVAGIVRDAVDRRLMQHAHAGPARDAHAGVAAALHGLGSGSGAAHAASSAAAEYGSSALYGGAPSNGAMEALAVRLSSVEKEMVVVSEQLNELDERAAVRLGSVAAGL